MYIQLKLTQLKKFLKKMALGMLRDYSLIFVEAYKPLEFQQQNIDESFSIGD